MDAELHKLLDVLRFNQKVLDLVSMMQPVEIIKVISKDCGLRDSDANMIVVALLDHIKENNFINNLGSLTPDFKSDQFPQPMPRPQEWPYDAMTKAALDPRSKGKKRPLMQGAFDPNSKKMKEPGGDGGKGIYTKNTIHSNNPTSSSSSSWDRKGTAGWSSSPPGKEFDLPDDLPDDIDIMKASPVGSPIPNFKVKGGRNPPRRMGYRRS